MLIFDKFRLRYVIMYSLSGWSDALIKDALDFIQMLLHLFGISSVQIGENLKELLLVDNACFSVHGC